MDYSNLANSSAYGRSLFVCLFYLRLFSFIGEDLFLLVLFVCFVDVVAVIIVAPFYT